MPNSRKKGKKKVAFWLTDAEIDLLAELAEIAQINRTDVMRTLLIKGKKIIKAKQERNEEQ